MLLMDSSGEMRPATYGDYTPSPSGDGYGWVGEGKRTFLVIEVSEELAMLINQEMDKEGWRPFGGKPDPRKNYTSCCYIKSAERRAQVMETWANKLWKSAGFLERVLGDGTIVPVV